MTMQMKQQHHTRQRAPRDRHERNLHGEERVLKNKIQLHCTPPNMTAIVVK